MDLGWWIFAGMLVGFVLYHRKVDHERWDIRRRLERERIADIGPEG